MTEVFVDTVYWLAVMNPGDALHQQAIQSTRPPRMVTTTAVQMEVMDAFSAPRHRPLAVRFWQFANSHPDLTIVPLDAQLLEQAVALFAIRSDKAWLLTDCLSFVVMEERGIFHALTSDHHYEQAGFRALMRSNGTT